MRVGILVLAVLGLAAVAIDACAGPCGPLTCSGCCDSAGVCQGGTTAAACGKEGLACFVCSTAAAPRCSAGVCKAPDAGTGGGGGSGGGAGGGGSSTLCRQVSQFPISSVLLSGYYPLNTGAGHFDVVRFETAGSFGTDTLSIELNYANDVGPTPPYDYAITSATYAQCSVCLVYYEGCNALHDCRRAYLARGGTLSMSRADRAPAGRLVGTASLLTFVAWDLAGDKQQSDACLELGLVPTFNVGFNADGGVPPP